MQVNCENCNTNFNLNEGLVKSTGSKVRCSKCKHIFVVYPSQPKAEAPKPKAPKPRAPKTTAPKADESSRVSAVLPETDDLDLSYIEKMLDSQIASQDREESLPVEEEDPVDTSSLNLADIEKMLDDNEDGDDLLDEKSDEDLVFDMDDDLLSGAAGEQISPATEIDLGDLEKMFEAEEEAASSMGDDFDADEDDGEFSLMSEKEDASPETEAGGDLLGFDLDQAEEGEEAGMFLDEKDEALAPREASEGPSELEELDLDATLKFDINSTIRMDPGTLTGNELDLGASIDFDSAEDEDEATAEEAEFDFESTQQIDPDSLSLDIGELDLESTITFDKALGQVPEGAGFGFESTQEIDPDGLSLDIEELDFEGTLTIDSADTSQAEPSQGGAFDLESDLRMESDDLSDGGDDIEISPEDAIEISDLDEVSLEMASPPAGDMEIELEDDGLEIELEGVDDEAMEYPDDAVPVIPDEEAFDEEAADYGDLEDLEDLEALDEEHEEIGPAAKSGSGVKKLLGLLSVLVLIVLLLAAFLFLNYKKIINIDLPYFDRVEAFLDSVEIPYLSRQKAAQVVDAGNLKITYNVDNFRFLETEQAGKLFLITGKVKNEYAAPRSFIQMSGSLYAKGKTLADTATAYCGNVIADLELSQMTPAAIRTRLGNRSGENESNVNIKPGEERPFMIVFFDLPESLDEFTVSVRGSEAGAK